ncbi:MAG TPA: LysR family transcriptional regulator [Candidatus Sulfotelmatobacter sp.]|nr:LysR family transcriptional regulator [Candidatus Sulfotelmatobacter sp.]
MDLKRLRYFCAIVEHGQISKAAAALNMAQPPLSLRLKELEEELGVTLIRRGTRWSRVTEEGRLLYDRAKLILSEVDALADDMKASHDTSICVVIGVSSTCASFLGNPLRVICARHPNAKLRVMLGDSSWLESMLRQRCIDLALMQPPADETGLLIEPLPPSRLMAIVPNSIVKPEWGAELQMADIAPFPLLLLRRSAGSGFYEKLIRWFHANSLTANVAMDCPDVRVLRDLWKPEMQAVALLPESEMRDFKPVDGRIFPLNEADMTYRPVIARLDTPYSNKGVSQVIEQIISSLDEAGGQDGTVATAI